MLKWPALKWKYIRFSDESHFHHNSRTADWVFRRRGERFQPDTIQKKFKVGASDFHVWAMLGWNFKSKLIFYGLEKDEGGNMTQQRYVNEILPVVKAYRDEAEAKRKESSFRRIMTAVMELGAQRILPWNIRLRSISTLSMTGQDLAQISPIENVWRILKQRVRQHCPVTKEELKKAIKIEWDALTQGEINRVVWGTAKGKKWTMHDRMQAVLDNNGRMTRY